jgi:hypothetical protein
MSNNLYKEQSIPLITYQESKECKYTLTYN